MIAKLAFLTSRRFWCLVAIAIIQLLKTEGILSDEIGVAFITILTGFIGLTTADKAIEAIKSASR